MKSHVSEQKLGHLHFQVFQILSPEPEYVLIEKNQRQVKIDSLQPWLV